MPRNLNRYYGCGHLHFITFSCHGRFALLGTVRARNVFVHALNEVRAKYGFALVGYVVMPNMFTCSSASQNPAIPPQ